MRNGGRSSRPAIPRIRMSRPAASRAAASAHSVDELAVSVICPNQPVGSPSSSAAQRSVTCSSSVAAGDVRHSIAFTFRAAAMVSPRMPGGEPVMPK